MDTNEIDIVITWVDGNDMEWREQRNVALRESGKIVDEASLYVRYRDWDNLQYIFRGIEKYMPWVRTIHFVTWGHLPKWLNVNHPKLNIVRHEDFIPKEYLPTFNSNAIELNLWRIPGLAEQFINFNDDMFVIANTDKEDFFKDGLPRDMACISPQPIQRSAIANIELNNLKIINDYFSIDDIKKNKKKWMNPFLYKSYAVRTAIFSQFKSIIGIFEPHIPFSHLKSVTSEIWEKEYEELDNASRHKFRSVEDVNEWLFRSWQLLSGKFVPRSPRFGLLVPASNTELVHKTITGKKYKMICINDDEAIEDFEETKKKVNAELNSILGSKSNFEI